MAGKEYLTGVKHENAGGRAAGGGGGPSNGLMGISHWMGSHLHDWVDYNDL